MHVTLLKMRGWSITCDCITGEFIHAIVYVVLTNTRSYYRKDSAAVTHKLDAKTIEIANQIMIHCMC